MDDLDKLVEEINSISSTNVIINNSERWEKETKESTRKSDSNSK